MWIRNTISPTNRVRVIVVNKTKILLIKGVIGTGDWSLPGGGVNRGETLVSAARRELQEETGICVGEDELKYSTSLRSRLKFSAPIFVVNLPSASNLTISRRWEIKDVGWFDLNDLPRELSPLSKEAIDSSLGRSLIE